MSAIYTMQPDRLNLCFMVSFTDNIDSNSLKLVTKAALVFRSLHYHLGLF